MKVNLNEKFNLIGDFWNPRIVGELNGQLIKLAKFKEAFIWHVHEAEDEFFYVVKGRLIMEFRDKVVEVNEHEFLIVPKGVEHRPGADGEAWIMMIEPASTVNTGNVRNELTRNQLEHL